MDARAAADFVANDVITDIEAAIAFPIIARNAAATNPGEFRWGFNVLTGISAV